MSDSNTKVFLIKTNFGEFTSFKDLQEYANKQYITLQTLLVENKRLQDEIENLKNILEKSTKLLEDTPTHRIIKTPAEVACERQIERLQEQAIQRELSLEETKKLDLFIKNLRLLQGDSTQIEGKTKKQQNITEAELIQIASDAIKKDRLNG